MVSISSDTEYSTRHSSDSRAAAGLVLPLIESGDFISQRHEVNPAIALNLLQEIQATVTTWQIQQRKIIQAMQALYAQGPMVDGWLQSSLTPTSAPATPDATVLRHGDADALMQYVEAMENSTASTTGMQITDGLLGQPSGEPAQYLLCSLAADGALRSQPCPPEQMALVSTAIARYQKFKQLKVKKQTVEAKLAQVVDQLTQVRTALREPI